MFFHGRVHTIFLCSAATDSCLPVGFVVLFSVLIIVVHAGWTPD